MGQARGEKWLRRYGGQIFLRVVLQQGPANPARKPRVYAATERFIEAADWVVWQLTGVETRNACTAGYKAMVQDGRYPSRDFFAALDPRFADIVETRWAAICPAGRRAGGLTRGMAAQTGLPPGIAVAVANVDAHVTAPAVQVTEPGRMVMIMGTSTCDILVGDELQEVEGMCGVVRDGIFQDTMAMKPGRAAWAISSPGVSIRSCPPEYHDRARAGGLDLHA